MALFISAFATLLSESMIVTDFIQKVPDGLNTHQWVALATDDRPFLLRFSTVLILVCFPVSRGAGSAHRPRLRRSLAALLHRA